MNNVNFLFQNCGAELVAADFAARVAKLASESASPTSVGETENSAMSLQISNQNSSNVLIRTDDCSKCNQFNDNASNIKENIGESASEVQKRDVTDTGTTFI